MNYNVSKWYWKVAGSRTQVYSSASLSYVPVTDATYVSWLAAGNLPTMIDTDTNLQLVLFEAGILSAVITSTATPSLNGSYSVSAEATANINAVTTYIMLNGNFPGDSASMPWIDAAGTPHTFSNIADFKNFATAIASYVSAISIYQNSNGTIGSIPSNELTIP